MSENWGLQLKFEGYARVDDPGVKYVLIFTTQELMSGTSPYDVLSWAPVILPVLGVVGAIPTGREIIYIQHSPFGRLHLEIVATIPTICRDGGEKDIKPKSAISARFAGRDARIFVSAMEPGADTTHFDTIIIMLGRESWVELLLLA
jgi:hypothetical protein